MYGYFTPPGYRRIPGPAFGLLENIEDNLSVELDNRAPYICPVSRISTLSRREMRVLGFLQKYRLLFIDAEKEWGIDRRAIGGAIVWEAMNNIKKSDVGTRFVGPGKVHVRVDRFLPTVNGFSLEWDRNTLAKQVEDIGYLPRLSTGERKAKLSTLVGSITYVAAIMAAAADIAAWHNYQIRCDPPMLTTFYNAWESFANWNKRLAKIKGAPLKVGPAMGSWVRDNLLFLEDGVGLPDLSACKEEQPEDALQPDELSQLPPVCESNP